MALAISNYDSKSESEILDELQNNDFTVSELENIYVYEKNNQNRQSILEEIDTQLTVTVDVPQRGYFGQWFDSGGRYTVRRNVKIQREIDSGDLQLVHYGSGAPSDEPEVLKSPIGHASTHEPNGPDALFDQDLSTGASPSFQSVDVERLSTKKGPVVNVKAWGAAGDGATNDTQEIQDALAHLKDAGGGTLFFPAGTYLVCEEPSPTATFDLRDKPNIEVCGVGYASHIKAEDGVASGSENGVIIFMGGDYAHIHNLRVDGNRANQGTITDTSDGANFVQLGGNSFMHDVWSVNSTGDGVEPFGDNVSIHNCYFDNNEEQDVHIWGSNSSVVGNICRNCQEDGAIRVYNSDTKGADVHGLRIEGNIIDSPATYGIGIDQDNTQTYDAAIVNNTILNPAEEGIRLNEGVRPRIEGNIIKGAGSDAIRAAVNCQAPRIRRNEVRNSTGDGVHINGVSEPHISDNFVTGVGGSGIRITSANALSNIRVTGNELKDNANMGILLYSNEVDFADVTLKNNEVYGTTEPAERGIYLNHSTAGTYSEVRIIGNDIQDVSAQPIRLESGVGVEAVSRNSPELPLSSAPSSPKRGTRVLADGTNWDPDSDGSAEYVVFNGTSWIEDVDLGTTY